MEIILTNPELINFLENNPGFNVEHVLLEIIHWVHSISGNQGDKDHAHANANVNIVSNKDVNFIYTQLQNLE